MKRKGISPVLATVILIAMTIVSAISVSGFVFGLYGSFTSNALVQAQFTSCDGAGTTCTLTLYNSGTSNANIYTGSGCATVTYSGTTVLASACSGEPGPTIPAGASLTVTITVPSTFNVASGSQVTGSIHLSNSAIVLFSGTFS